MKGYINGKPDVTWWMQQIHAGIKFRKKMTYQASWATWRKYYRSEFSDQILPVNLFFKMARTIVPRIYFRNPGISIVPNKPGMLNWAFAQLLERIDNKLIRQMGMKKKSKRAVGNAWFFGTGILKVGFGSAYGYNFDLHGGEAPKVKGRYDIEHNADIASFMPWVDSIHPGNFIVPDQQIDYEKTPWTAEWIRRPTYEVEADPRLRNNKNIKSATKSAGTDFMNEFKATDNLQQTDLIEIHDLRCGRCIVLAPFASNRELFCGDDDLQFAGRGNYVPIIFNENDDAFWGLPDSKILEPDQLEINEVRTLMMYHWRLSVAKIAYQIGKIDPSQVDKIMNGEVMAALGIKGDIRAAFEIFNAGEVPDSLFKADAQINQDVREGMGFSRNEFGEFTPPSSRTSATEAKIVKMASEIRIDERRDMAADALVETMEAVNHVIFNEWHEEHVLEVAGPVGVPLWVKFRPDMLSGGAYTIKIDPDTSLPETKDAREQRALTVYNVLKTNPLVDPIRLTRYLLHELHGVQFDDMMRGMPPGLGGPSDPMELQDFIRLVQEVATKAPQAITAMSQQQPPGAPPPGVQQ